MITAYMLIKASHGKIKIVSNALSEYEEVVEVNELFGRFDILIKVNVEKYENLNGFNQNKLQITEGIMTCETLLVRDAESDEEAED